MTLLFPVFVGLMLLVLALLVLLIAGGGALWLRWAGLSVSAALMAGVYAAGTETLGRAKPARMAMIERGAGQARLVAAHMIEGAAIYLWLILPDAAAPRAYVLPWSTDVAEHLRKAMAEAGKNGTQVRVTDPFDGSLVPADQFSAPPPPTLPPKRAG